MKTKILVSIFLTVCLVLAFAVPASAAKPITITYPPGSPILNEIIMGVPIVVIGGGTITNHVVKTPASSEESWFKISSFTGFIRLPSLTPPPPYYFDTNYDLSDVEVHFHMGNGAGQQPLITIRSSEPIAVPGLFATYFNLYGTYTMIQMVGGKIIYAK